MTTDERAAIEAHGHFRQAAEYFLLVYWMQDDPTRAYHWDRAMESINAGLAVLGMMAIEAPQSGQDRSIGMTMGDVT